ncbi:MAG: hypothetical protein LLF96_04445 [Eubacteriales bacterium]|nr:hypothetical protein [Eubacteriales bacterium]
MKHTFLARLCALALTLCLAAAPALSHAETWLPDGEVTHADFTLGLQLHADAFPQSQAHLNDWETFLRKLSLRGSMDALAMFTPNSRVYLDAALQLNGEDQFPFVYDGYYSYRYLLSPALGGEILYFQMYNFLEFMLKPYYYMELPTQYLALLLYPNAAYWLGDSYYTPVAEMLTQARENALAAQEEASASAVAGANDPTTILVASPADAQEDELTYNIPYEDLYELCETLDLIVNDDVDLSRAYFFFTCLLTDLYASDMTLEILGNLEYELDALDPDQNGMTVVQTPDSLTCTIGDTSVFTQTSDGDATAFTLTLPTAEGYELTLNYRWTPSATGAALSAALGVTSDGEQAILLTAEGEGLPQEGDLDGEGSLTLGVSGAMLESEPSPQTFTFAWSRDAAQKPYTLGATLNWLHPDTGKPALTLVFNGKLSTVDKSVFVDGDYPQNDFFSLNETYLEGYKERLMKTMILKLTPIALEMPAGVIDDIFRFADDTDILVSFME